MILQFLLGVCFYDEALTIMQFVCIGLIVIAILFNIRKEENSGKTYLYYIMVFILNGLAVVISKIYQASNCSHVGSADFMFISALICIVICGVVLLIKCRRIVGISPKNIFCLLGNCINFEIPTNKKVTIAFVLLF